MNFSNIIGNEDIKVLLDNLIKTNSLVHSYMFMGVDGIGKMLFANDFAKMILCHGQSKACNSCSSCIKFNSNNHPDFIQIDSEDDKSIKINKIRFLQEKISEKPIISDRKVYLINNCDLMTVEAQNCLLKTLEEPPEYAVIILVLSNENKLLSTIKSRCTKIVFQKLTNTDLIQYANVNNLKFNSSLLSACDGSISKLLNLQGNIETYSLLDNIISSLSNDNIIDIWNKSDILYRSKDNIITLLEYFNTVFLEKLKNTKDAKYISAIKIIEDTKNKLSNNANYDMCIDNLLLQIWEEFNEGYSRS